MNFPIRIWSKAYAPSPDTDQFSIQVDKHIWQEAMRTEGAKRKFLRIKHPQGLEAWIAPIGQPVTIDYTYDEEESKEERIYDIFLPLWMVDTAHFSGEGDVSEIEILDEEYFPEASRLVFRVIDSAFYNSDIKDELEKALSSLGIVQQHTTLQIPVAALGGYSVEVFVSKTEPANIVLCDGEEVAVEFEEPVDQIAPPRPPTPVPQPPPLLQTDGMIPESIFQQPPQGFQAFQGEGRTLGGSNVNIPEWRRGLPPPRRS
jgi:hypothetical protein